MEVFCLKKNIIISTIVLLLLIIILSNFKPIQVSELIVPYTNEGLPKKISSSIYFSYASEKELEVTGEKSIKKIVTLVENMKVRKKITLSDTYTPKLKSTYHLSFYGPNDEIQSIYILNNKCIIINHKTYKIVGTPNLSSIYDIIILDQPEGSLDEFYYDLIQ